ncbi:MAG: YihA family ribosome biogenesis GTP-binding protein [Gammaproteobacteria bacterium]|nr:YihA family ribosome biogenesis GTP-binding protein [Gammaproteobacteria bacterium]
MTSNNATAAIDFRRAEFIKSAADAKDFPPDQGAEVAFIGRSNAGKSSALNAICNRQGLARTSKTPGRTQLVNFFEIDGSRKLVDLPGYGYARVSPAKRAGWSKMIGDYFFERQCLRGIVLLMDSRHPLTEKDAELLDWLAPVDAPLLILLTKSDKLKRGPAQNTLLKLRQQLDQEMNAQVQVELFSALKKTGVDKARSIIAPWLN